MNKEHIYDIISTITEKYKKELENNKESNLLNSFNFVINDKVVGKENIIFYTTEIFSSL